MMICDCDNNLASPRRVSDVLAHITRFCLDRLIRSAAVRLCITRTKPRTCEMEEDRFRTGSPVAMMNSSK